MKYFFMVVHRCARSAEETIINSGPRSSRPVARERAIGGWNYIHDPKRVFQRFAKRGRLPTF
jgi:hypothetical protein